MAAAILLLTSCGAGAEAWAEDARRTYEADGWEVVSELRAIGADTYFAATPVRLAFVHPERIRSLSPDLRVMHVLWLDRSGSEVVEDLFTNVVDCSRRLIAFVEGTSLSATLPPSPEWRAHEPGDAGYELISWACRH